MKTTSTMPLFRLVESFFRDHLQRMRGASAHTVRAYRDGLKILFEFVAAEKRRGVAELQLADLDAAMIARFLAHLETERSNSVATRNCRRAALRSFFKHLLRHDLDRAEQYSRVLAIPAKKAKLTLATYLEADDVRCILRQPDRRTVAGCRDHALLLFLYNTGARVSEAAAVRYSELQLNPPRQVRLHGKGKKDRLCPLWRDTAKALQHLARITNRSGDDHVFVNRQSQVLSRDGIAYILRKHTMAATAERPGLAKRNITPHVLRHSCAVGLLQSGTDITVIRDYLGHASIATTGRYLTTNLKMKREALESFWKHAGIAHTRSKPWNPTPDLLAYLNSL